MIPMGKRLAFIAILIFISSSKTYAFDYSRPNNKVGMHLAQPHLNDILKASELVNANGGDWGYVTLVIQDNDRNKDKWQEIFDLLREKHIIPLIRIATHPEGASWRRPVKEEAQGWADFLNSLNWVTKNRYVILFNEPNHAEEWGNTVDAYNFAETVKEFAEKLKAKNPDFFIMMGAIDASAPTSMPRYLGEEYFMQNIFQVIKVEDFERLFDGLCSHSYPNPAFSGNPFDSGRGTVRSYQWELDLLKNLGVKKDLPVFITETGWTDQKLSREAIASNYQTAFQSVWFPDQKVAAVTPFVFDYQGDPFLGFSWKKFQSDEYYPQFYSVQNIQKVKGEPEIIDTGNIVIDFPKELVAHSNYHFRIRMINNGQAIWDKKNGYQLTIVGNGKEISYTVDDIKRVRPHDEAVIDMLLQTSNITGKKIIRIAIQNDKGIVIQTNNLPVEIVPLPNLNFKVELYPKLISEGDQFEIQIFDEKEGLIYKRGALQIHKGSGYVDDIQNIILGKKYRIVLLNKYYLPRQSFIAFERGMNTIKFKRMFPLDADENGHVDWGDLGALIAHPELMRLFFP